MNNIEQLRGKLVVSCQALEDEPLHSSEIMAKMALAAKVGGASGIRANSAKDIKAIKQEVNLPVIGIIKRGYADSEIYITATLCEVKELLDCGIEVLAIDATHRKRPKNERLESIIEYVKEHSPETSIMADISTVEEAIDAEKMGFSCVGTTLIGYTKETEGKSLIDNDFAFLKELTEKTQIPVIAEGRIETPQLAARALELGAAFIVVGSAITRPQLITQSFVEALQ